MFWIIDTMVQNMPPIHLQIEGFEEISNESISNYLLALIFPKSIQCIDPHFHHAPLHPSDIGSTSTKESYDDIELFQGPKNKKRFQIVMEIAKQT